MPPKNAVNTTSSVKGKNSPPKVEPVDKKGEKEEKKDQDVKDPKKEKKSEDAKNMKNDKETKPKDDKEVKPMNEKDAKPKDETKGKKTVTKHDEGSKEGAKHEAPGVKQQEGTKNATQTTPSPAQGRPAGCPKPLQKLDDWVEKTFKLTKFRTRVILYSLSIGAFLLLIIIIGVAAGVAGAAAAGGCPEKYKKLSATHSYCKPASPDLISAGISDADKQVIVNLHNQKRVNPVPLEGLKGMNMQKVYWDDEVAKIADKYARTCPSDHDTFKDRAVPDETYQVGQNLAFGYPTWTEAIDSWFSENTKFSYGTGGDINAIGHYVLMIIESVAKIGCGYAFCMDDLPIYVCHYAFFDYSSKQPFRAGIPCSNCSSACDRTMGLCDCKALMCSAKKNVDCKCG